MGRVLYLEYISWGRSCWSPPDENEWDHVTQQSRPAATASSPPIAGHSSNHVQQYDESLRPTNPKSQRLGKDLRRAANNILSVIGVVRRTDDFDPERARRANEAESRYVAPIKCLTRLSWGISAQWMTGVLLRLLAFPPPPDQSLAQTISQDYALLGPLEFFLGGLPTQLVVQALLWPSGLANHACYWTLRFVISRVSDRKTRQDVINHSSKLFRVLHFTFEFLTFQLWLQSTLQDLGLRSVKAMLPNPRDFFSLDGPESMQFPALLMGSLFYQTCSPYLRARLVHPAVKPVVAETFTYLRRFRSKPSPATVRPGLSAAPLERTPNSAALNGRIRPAQRTGHIPTQVTPIPPNSSTDTTGVVLNFMTDAETNAQASGLVELILATEPSQPVGRLDAGPTTPEHVSPSDSTHRRRDLVNEEINHRIRISEFETPEGRSIPELNIHLYEPLATADSSTDMTKRRKTSPLSLVPQETLTDLVSICLHAMLTLPIDLWLTRQLARWWIKTYGLQGLMGSSPRVAQLLLPSGPLLSRSSLLSVVSLSGKMLLGLAIRESMLLGIWIAQTQGIILLGKKKLKWGEQKGEEK